MNQQENRDLIAEKLSRMATGNHEPPPRINSRGSLGLDVEDISTKVNTVEPSSGTNILVILNNRTYSIPLDSDVIKFSALQVKLSVAAAMPIAQLQGKPFSCTGCQRRLIRGGDCDQLLPVECCKERSLTIKEELPPAYSTSPRVEVPSPSSSSSSSSFFLAVDLPEVEAPFALEVQPSDSLGNVLSRAQRTAKRSFFRIGDVTVDGSSLRELWGSNWRNRSVAECPFTSTQAIKVIAEHPESVFVAIVPPDAVSAREVKEIPLPEKATGKDVLEALKRAGMAFKEPAVMNQIGAIYRREGITKRSIFCARADGTWGLYDEENEGDGEVDGWERSYFAREFLNVNSRVRSAPRRIAFVHFLENTEFMVMTGGNKLDQLNPLSIEDRFLVAMIQGYRLENAVLFELCGGLYIKFGDSKVFTTLDQAQSQLVKNPGNAKLWRRLIVFISDGESVPNVKPPAGAALKIWKRWGEEVVVKSQRIVLGGRNGNSKEEEEGRGWLGSGWVYTRSLGDAVNEALQ